MMQKIMELPITLHTIHGRYGKKQKNDEQVILDDGHSRERSLSYTTSHLQYDMLA